MVISIDELNNYLRIVTSGSINKKIDDKPVFINQRYATFAYVPKTKKEVVDKNFKALSTYLGDGDEEKGYRDNSGD